MRHLKYIASSKGYTAKRIRHIYKFISEKKKKNEKNEKQELIHWHSFFRW